MPKLIKNNAIIDNGWTTVEKDYEGDLGQAQSLVPKALWLGNADALAGNTEVGVWLDSDEGPEELEPYLKDLSVIAINFPKFADGRGYSYARILRERYGYEGEIRAIGDVLHDQLFYLSRCGFDAFAIRDDKDAEAAFSGLSDFSETYQAACDQAQPLFRRRA